MPFLDSDRWYELHAGANSTTRPRPALFLDRDGVIIAERIYLRDPEQVELFPGVVEKLQECRRLEIPVVVITNQSGIARGFFDWAQYELVHRRMLELCCIENPFAGVYANAHSAGDTDAVWRKPNPGMLIQAAQDLNICLESSVLVGDKAIDLEAGKRAGILDLIHVHTGHGQSERGHVMTGFPNAMRIDSLADLEISRFPALVTGDCSYIDARREQSVLDRPPPIISP